MDTSKKAKRFAYYEKNKKKIQAWQSEWKKRNRDRLRDYDKNYRKKHPERAYVRNLNRRILGIGIEFTVEQYLELLKKQDGVCAICRNPDDGRNLSIDHCHKTGKVRGLLCKKCNSGLGFFNDELLLVEKAHLYLKNNHE